ncbi:MAG: TetR/AcrR family transcriptional regulator [Rhodobacteraceae bacterium]|nr:TetR/AcrR family transcriptional regulator [Paracoccaceae bacterium]
MAVAPRHSGPAEDPRAQEILSRIKGVFSQKGFDGASMQALARAAGMSAGNFYRYFPSKNAIIEAMVAFDLADIEREFAAVMSSPDPVAALRAGIASHMEAKDGEDGALWAEIEAAAARRPEIAAVSGRLQSQVGSHLVRVFARISGVPEAEAAVRFAPHAALFMILIKGTVIGTCGQDGPAGPVPTPDLRALVMRMIDFLIDEIAGARSPAAPGGLPA